MSKQEVAAKAAEPEHDATYKPSPGHKGLALVKVLLAHGGTPDPARIAELIEEHPQHTAEIAHFIHKHLGGGFMERVKAALPAAHAAERHNLEMGKLVDPEEGYTSKRARDRAKQKHHEADPDLNRIADHNHLPKLAKPAKVYDNMGGVHGECAVGEVEINAGAVSRLMIDGVVQECIYVYKAKPTSPGDLLFGWVPVTSFVQNAVLRHVVETDERINRKMEKRQEHRGAEFSETPELVTPKPVPDDMAELRIMANAREFEPDHGDGHKTKSHDNFARHYYLRPDAGGGAVNLLANVPGSSATRIGVATDRVAANSSFFRATNIAPAYTPLYITGGNVQSAKAMKFVYGYTTNNLGERQYGWLLADHLPG